MFLIFFFFLHLPLFNFLAHFLSPFLFVHGYVDVKVSSATISRTRVERRIRGRVEFVGGQGGSEGWGGEASHGRRQR